MLDVLEGLQAAQKELEDRLEVLGRRSSHEDVRAAEGHGARKTETEGSGLAASASSRQGHGAAAASEVLGLALAQAVDEGQHCMRLVLGLREGYQTSNLRSIADT